MCMVKAVQSEPIPGYRLIEPLGQGGFGEVWKCEAPGGLFKAIKFLRGGDPQLDPQAAGARQELRALQHIKSIRHPFLLSIERIEVIDDEVLIVMELADRSLHDLLAQRRAAGQTGIARKELLGYLRETAEALDLLNQEYSLQHLDIKPRNLFLIGRHVKVADFGLVTSLSEPHSQSSWLRRSETLTPLYAAPETFLGRFSTFSDQYSLAVSYQELLTGTLPFTGRNFRQLALRHLQEPPELTPLPEADRSIVARALAKEPAERFPSCCAFVRALIESQTALAAPVTPTQENCTVAVAGSRPVRTVAAPSPPRVSEPASEANVFLADYQLLECLHRHEAAELWKAQTTGGRLRLIRILNGHDPAEAHPGGDPLLRLRELRHPALPRYETQTGVGGRLALITDMPDSVLVNRLRECRQIGHAGIPRPELLAYLRQTAEALDDLSHDYGLQHLCLCPRQLGLRGGLLYLLDFGLTELFWLPAGHDAAALNLRYAAPELFDHRIGRHSDQYSLALIYHELLTGIHAFRNLNPRQMALARQRGTPDLGMLPSTDRSVIAQALHLDPEQRFPSCTALVDALESTMAGRSSGGSSHGTNIQVATVPLASVKKQAPTSSALDSIWSCSLDEMKEFIAEQVAGAAGRSETRKRRTMHYRIERGSTAALPALEHQAHGRIVPATVPLKLAGFEQEWKAKRLEAPREPAALDDGGVVVSSRLYRIEVGGSLWERCLGRAPALLVRIELTMPQTSTEAITEISVQVQPTDCKPDRAAELLESVGPRLLESLRSHLQLPSDRRGEERLEWLAGVQVRPLRDGGRVGEAFAAQIRDISSGGLGLELRCYPPCDFLLVEMSPPQRPPLAVPVQVLHTHRLGDGRHLVGGRFAWELVPTV